MFGRSFIANKRIKHLVIDFKAKHLEYVKYVSDDYFSTSIFSAHAPMEEKDDDEKDNCYEYLDQIYEECPKRDVKIIIGDLNTQIGQEETYSPFIGKCSLHISN